MRVGSPCFLHYSVFCLVTCHQVLVRFRSSLDSDTLRSSCLRPSAVKVSRHTREKPLLPKVGAPPPPTIEKATPGYSCRGNRVCTKSNFLHIRNCLYINSVPFFSPAMTTWFCVSSETTTLTVAGLVVVYLIFYFLMERKHNDSSSQYSETA